MKIQPQYINAVRQATSASDLMPLVQNAIELEHATIPPYLCGLFTMKPGTNSEVSQIIRSVVIEEMLHMTHAANLLSALGGSPAINEPTFVPDYPLKLPMGIGDNLKVHLRKCSVDQVRDVFMAIEEPEDPIDVPIGTALSAEALADEQFDTIGAFYEFLAEKIAELGDGIFAGDPRRQVVPTHWFPDPDKMFAITDVRSATKAIEVIVDQGEGTHTDPFDKFGEPAHYYRFEEIVVGRKLIEEPGKTPPYSFGGDPVVLDTGELWDMDDDPKIAKYKPGSMSRRKAEQFSYSYTRLLSSLHNAFNGDPAQLDNAMGVMYELRLLSQQVLETPAVWADPGITTNAQTGLCFEYRALNQ